MKEFIYPVGEVAAWTGRTGDVAHRDLQEQCPDELGIHPDQKRWAVTYAGASAYVKRSIAHDAESEAKRLAFDEHLGHWEQDLHAARTEAFNKTRDKILAARPHLVVLQRTRRGHLRRAGRSVAGRRGGDQDRVVGCR